MFVSFIVIGRNEEENLNCCFDSIGNSIEVNDNFEYECIFVDSNSIDNSVQIAYTHLTVDKVIKLTGNVNSAIARNVGANYSRGEILFFIDGDMQLNPSFLNLIISKTDSTIIHPIITGDLINIMDGKESYYYGRKLRRDSYHDTNGGVFIIEKNLWDRFKGMDIRFKRSQDLDFFFNLSCNGLFILRKKEVICYHYTSSYHSKKRLFHSIKSMYGLYTGLFYRKYLLKSIRIIKLMIRKDYSALMLLLSIAFVVLYKFNTNGLIMVFSYLLIILLRNIMSEGRLNINYFVFRIINDVFVTFGLLVFYPCKKKVYKIETLAK